MLGLELNHVNKRGHWDLRWINFNPSMDTKLHINYGMKLRVIFQTSTVQPLKFGNGYVILFHALLGVWLLVHTGSYSVMHDWMTVADFIQLTNDCCKSLLAITSMILLLDRLYSEIKDRWIDTK